MVMVRRRQKPVTWVVYRRATTHKRKRSESNAVCEQSEWDAMERAEPGVRALVRAGFEHEADAERHARGTSGDAYRRGRRA